jgi:hypothetical protein
LISSAFNHLVERAGVSIRKKKQATPRMTVTIPSRIKIHLHPSRPPTPSI